MNMRFDPRKTGSNRNPVYDRPVPPGLVIYCDGACEPNPGIGGWGFVVYRDGKEQHADRGGSNPTTNNIMELTGALRSLRWLHEHFDWSETPRLFCDSMYVVNGCNEWRHTWKARGWKRKGKNPDIANLDLWKELDEVLALVPIKLDWCKGHAGIVGNERADQLSLEGIEAIQALQPDPLAAIREQLDYRSRGW
ncbi:ribonuclease H [Mesorhizobium amorphae]|uniref:ribonuclease H family protein n=1 Tax=Mesorhizobium amorphae TaxID=71433 RepID=UPI0021B1D4DA|nr:ribonuclease H [Mesorhizobium amorphae]